MIETKLNNLEINELTQEQYESAKVSGSLNSDAFYMTPSAENASDILPIIKGGTGANIAADARTNLGFEYGEEVPTHIPETGDGAIYFKIDDEDDGITPIEHGGTGAITGYDALRNLGAVDYVIEQGERNGWAYRKWNSGWAECWTSQTGGVSGTVTPSALLGGYYTYTTITLPFEMIYNSINAFATAKLGTGLGFGYAGANSSTSVAVYAIGNQADSYISYNLYVKGRWK